MRGARQRGSVRRLLHHGSYADLRSELEPTMNRHLTPINGNGGARRRRPARPLPLYALLPEPRTAAAMEDAAAAEELIADLLALVDAGLVTPVEDAWGDLRYAPADGDDAGEVDATERERSDRPCGETERERSDRPRGDPGGSPAA
jgi:hypothetical protein